MSRFLLNGWLPLVGVATCLVATPALAVPTGFQLNYDEGRAAGFALGYDEGFVSGTARGTSEGTTQGRETGYETGWDEAYGPAYDAAYTMQFPLGYDKGVFRGLQSGFDEGVAWAQTVAQTVSGSNWLYETYGSGAVIVWRGGILDVTRNTGGYGGASGSLSIATSVEFWTIDYDWAAHYYDLGFGEGKTSGVAAGSTAGYDAAFPAAYEAAYDIAYPVGLDAGDAAGTAQGSDAGFSDGWDLGFDDAYYVGFDAGAEYFVTGKLSLPDDFRAAAARLSVPEPSTLALVGMALTAVLRRAPRERRRAA